MSLSESGPATSPSPSFPTHPHTPLRTNLLDASSATEGDSIVEDSIVEDPIEDPGAEDPGAEEPTAEDPTAEAPNVAGPDVAGPDAAGPSPQPGVAEAHAAASALIPRLAARAEEHDVSATFPAADFDDLRGSGLLGLLVPARLGGFGASFADYADVALALGRGNGSTALIFNMHASVTGALAQTPEELLHAAGVPDRFVEARDRVLAAAASGALYAVAMSERGSGSRLSQTTTRYHRTRDGFRITGSKAFVSGAGHADAYLVAAREATAAEPVISYFLVPAGPGIRVEPTWDALGMRATCSHDVHFDVDTDSDALLGGIEGLAPVLAQTMPQWLVASYSAVYAGVAQAVLDAGAAYLRERELDALPMVRARMGRADPEVAATTLVVREAAARVAHHPGTPETNRWVWRAKLRAGDTAAEVASSVLEAAGTGATRRGHPLERLYRDARCGALQPATSDVCTDWLGNAVLDRDPEAPESETGTPRW